MTIDTKTAKIPPHTLILHIGLPLIILTLTYIALCAATPETFLDSALTVHRRCVTMLEHALMSLTLTIGGSTAFAYFIG